MKEKVKNILWTIRAYMLQPFVPTVSVDYLFKHDCAYVANNFVKDKYVYYWEGDSKTGKEVKVKGVDLLRHEYEKLDFQNQCRQAELLNLIKEVETHDLGETFVKNEIIDVINMNWNSI